MSKYIDADKLKAEIERLKKLLEGSTYYLDNSQQALGYSFALDDFDEFLDTLSEEPDNYASLEASASYDTQKYTPIPSVDIEDVARVQFASHAKVFDRKRKAVFDWGQFKEVAGIFYAFGKKDSETKEYKQPEKSLEEEFSRIWDKELSGECDTEAAFKVARHFAQWQKEQMLKDAVEGEAEELYNDGESQCTVGVGTYFKPGDKVIVLKAEEEWNMIPDKIYVREYQDGEYTTWWDEKPHEEESIGMKAVCYIRKDALLEWAEKCKKIIEGSLRVKYDESLAIRGLMYAIFMDKLNET